MQIKEKYRLKEPYGKSLIEKRGIVNYHNFLYPTIKNLQDPFDFDNIEEGINLIKENVCKKTLLVVDSDADGYCSAAIIYQYLKNLYPDWEIEIFLHEGKQHGLEDVIEKLDLEVYSLIIIPDAGSNDDIYFNTYPQTQFLVIDHHLRTTKNPIPPNAIIINNQLSEEYVNKSLSGGGVTWQFCRMFDQLNGTNYADDFIDLAAVSIIADVMDITTLENRYIISTGLKNINNEFLKLLINNASFQLQGRDLSPVGIAFYVVPNINAMTRMGTMEEKERMWWAFIDPRRQVECFKRGVAKGTLTDVVIESARECTNVKARQKRMQEKMAELCDKTIIEGDLLKNKILVLQLDETFENMPSELNGLTATKIANETGHPTLIGRVGQDNVLKGSIRGLTTIDMPPLKTFLTQSGYFTMLEGHENAAGFALPIEKLERFIDWANSELEDIDLNNKTWDVDFIAGAYDDELKQVIFDFDELGHLWGQGFPEPLIHVHGILGERNDVQVMGSKADTVKITANGIAYMFFRRSQQEVKKLTAHSFFTMSIVGTANLNTYRGKRTPQIFVQDYELVSRDFSF